MEQRGWWKSWERRNKQGTQSVTDNLSERCSYSGGAHLKVVFLLILSPPNPFLIGSRWMLWSNRLYMAVPIDFWQNSNLLFGAVALKNEGEPNEGGLKLVNQLRNQKSGSWKLISYWEQEVGTLLRSSSLNILGQPKNNGLHREVTGWCWAFTVF